jgi:anaphase-promoting complex subunit 11
MPTESSSATTISSTSRKRRSDTAVVAATPSSSDGQLGAGTTTTTNSGSSSSNSKLKIRIQRYHGVAQWVWGNHDPNEVCGICQSAYEGVAPGGRWPGEDCPVVWGKCSHSFHLQCVVTWLNGPTARKLLTQVSYPIIPLWLCLVIRSWE